MYLGYTVFLHKFILFYILKSAFLRKNKKELLVSKRNKGTVFIKIDKANKAGKIFKEIFKLIK